ncbi:MAG: hypothetical protein ACRD8U_00420 [Pyrinomonadaceae bacterium]
MRFEVTAALAIGILLPVLETCRRGLSEWSLNFTTMFEDYLAGTLLLIGGWAAYRDRPWGRLFLVLAWAWFAGIMSGSLSDQLEGTIRSTVAEPNNLLVVLIKFILWAIAVVSLALSFKKALRNVTTN